ncbi:MAG TPA: hypothetical protein VNC61_06585 [Acidimicrobiales bacterium]|nr:hypothetical protein [Acidimicrobiales bacterium]
MKLRRNLAKIVALAVLISTPLLTSSAPAGAARAAAAKNPVGSAKWCAAHPAKARGRGGDR